MLRLVLEKSSTYFKSAHFTLEFRIILVLFGRFYWNALFPIVFTFFLAIGNSGLAFKHAWVIKPCPIQSGS